MKASRKIRILYTHYLPWSKLIRLVEVGQTIMDSKDEHYLIKQKLISNRKGSVPQLVLEKLPT